MGRLGGHTSVGIALLTWACAFSPAGRAGESPPPTPAAEAAQTSSVGATISSEEWSLTLIEPSYKVETVGKGTNCGPYSAHVGCLRTAEGIWAIAAIRLTNQASELKFVPRTLFLVSDAQGRESILASRNAHADFLWEMEDDRWEPTVNQVPDNMLDSGEIIEGPVIFDVPVDATRLVLEIEGMKETIELGF